MIDRAIITAVLLDLGEAVDYNNARKDNATYRNPLRALRILMEEVGEVADALSPPTAGTKPPKHDLDHELMDTAVAVITWMCTRRENVIREAEANLDCARRTVGIGSQGDGSSELMSNAQGELRGADGGSERGAHGVLAREADQDATAPDRMGKSQNTTDIGGRRIHPSIDPCQGDRISKSVDRGGYQGKTTDR